MWQPDGAGHRAKIGVLTPHLDPVPESELNALAPTGVSIHSARVPLGMVGPNGEIVPQVGPEVARAFSEPPEADHAVRLLSPLKPDAIIYAFTSSSYILGAKGDARLKARLEEVSGGIPVVIQTMAVVDGLRALGARTIALIHPPWFTGELDELGASYFRNAGFDLVHHGPAELRSDYGDILPNQIHEWAAAHTPDEADVLVIGGGGFRAIGAVEALESTLDRPVLTGNQASLWAALRIAEVAEPLPTYGRVFGLLSRNKEAGSRLKS